MDIAIIDTGIGFADIPDVRTFSSSAEYSNTLIVLTILDKRLELLFGEKARIKIESVPNLCTTISFRLPRMENTI